MEKWADYCISQVSWDSSRNLTTFHMVHVDKGSSVGKGVKVPRSWVIKRIFEGYTFVSVTKNKNGRWCNGGFFTLQNNYLKWPTSLPVINPSRKTFISYYHYDDQIYKDSFVKLTSDLITNKSVKEGDINADNRDNYVKRLIQDGYLSDTTILVVLVGPNTKYRKHIDWEISGALNLKVGGSYSGLLGILLPTHPDYGRQKYYSNSLPKRLAANAKSNYAKIYDWSEDRIKLQNRIEDAFNARTKRAECIVNRKVTQLKRNILNP